MSLRKCEAAGALPCSLKMRSRWHVSMLVAYLWHKKFAVWTCAQMTPAGLEPAIPGSVGRCLIHWATGPLSMVGVQSFAVPCFRRGGAERKDFTVMLRACPRPSFLPLCNGKKLVSVPTWAQTARVVVVVVVVVVAAVLPPKSMSLYPLPLQADAWFVPFVFVEEERMPCMASTRVRLPRNVLRILTTAPLGTWTWPSRSQDSLAVWSKALAQGASPQGRGFEPHSCHLCVVSFQHSHSESKLRRIFPVEGLPECEGKRRRAP